MGVKTPDVLKTQAKTNLCLAGAAEGSEARKNAWLPVSEDDSQTCEKACVAEAEAGIPAALCRWSRNIRTRNYALRRLRVVKKPEKTYTFREVVLHMCVRWELGVALQ